MEKISQKLRSKIKEKLYKQAFNMAPMIVNPLAYGALGAGVGGLAGGLKSMYNGQPFEYGAKEGLTPGLQAGMLTGGLMGLGPAIMQARGKQVANYNPINALNIAPAAAMPAIAGWQSMPSYR
tara:strand:+ start:1023 stop:1391 length:369 start_codon:yes stop_codon:yes gene_type:complete